MPFSAGVAEVLLGRDNEGLERFFSEALGGTHGFKVAMARRCFNLCHVFTDGNCTEGEREVITQNALQLYAGDFADRLLEVGSFPRFLLFDDILLHGRAVYNALYRMEDIVFRELEARGAGVGRRTVHRKMLTAADVAVYALGDVDDIIDSAYLYKVRCSDYRHGSDMMHLSRSITQFLAYCGEANTDHQLSFRLEASAPDVSTTPSWENVRNLRWSDSDLALFSNAGGNSSSLHAVHLFSERSRGRERRWATGFPCVESIPRRDVDELSRYLGSALAASGHHQRLSRVLSSGIVGYAGFKTDLLALLDSAESLRQLTVSTGQDWNRAVQRSDLPRISRNFGKGSDVWEALGSVLRDQGLLQSCSEQFRAKATCVSARKPASGAAEDGFRATRAENIMCAVGMEAEREAYDFSRNRRTFVPLAQSADTLPLAAFLRRLEAEDASEGARGDPKGDADARSIACVMDMSRRGMNSVRYALSIGGEDVTCCLKAGELSAHAFPQRHRYALLALKRVEAAARMRLRPPIEVLDEFVEWLASGQNSEFLDEPLLDDLRENIQWFVGTTYYCNGSMARWEAAYRDSYDVGPAGGRPLDHARLESSFLRKADQFIRALAEGS